MKQYMLVMEQIADGCDYSIACGVEYVTFKANNIEEARRYAHEYWMGDDYDEDEEHGITYEGDYELQQMYLCEVVEKCPIERWMLEVQNKRAVLRNNKIAEEELKELARLRAKYNT